MKRTRLTSTSSWAKTIGYSRATRVGNMVFVSGTTAINAEGKLVGLGDPETQTTQVLENIRSVLESLGSRMEDVVQTRIYVTDMECVGESRQSTWSIFFFAKCSP